MITYKDIKWRRREESCGFVNVLFSKRRIRALRCICLDEVVFFLSFIKGLYELVVVLLVSC